MLIYKATNKYNGKCYIGQTVYSLEKRKLEHLQDARAGRGFRFHEAIRKYGEDSFTWEVIDTANTIEELTEKEGYWINYYKSYYEGYNDTKGDLNPMFFPDVKDKHKNKMQSDKVRNKISITMKRYVAEGKIFGLEHRKHLSEAMKGNTNGHMTPEIQKLAQKALYKSVSCYSSENNELLGTFKSVKAAIEWWKTKCDQLPKSRETLYEKVKRSNDLGISYNGVYWKYNNK